MAKTRVERLGDSEIGWWQAHHRKDNPTFLKCKIGVLVDTFGITEENARTAVNKFIDAAKEHDLAEELEDKGNQEQANTHWEKARQLLIEHYRLCLGDENKLPLQTGKYRNYKGKEYYVLGVVTHSETKEEMVLYRALYDDGQLWVRPAKMFLEKVKLPDGKEVPRFEKIED